VSVYGTHRNPEWIRRVKGQEGELRGVWIEADRHGDRGVGFALIAGRVLQPHMQPVFTGSGHQEIP
jgi:hypothetical protein